MVISTCQKFWKNSKIIEIVKSFVQLLSISDSTKAFISNDYNYVTKQKYKRQNCVYWLSSTDIVYQGDISAGGYATRAVPWRALPSLTLTGTVKMAGKWSAKFFFDIHFDSCQSGQRNRWPGNVIYKVVNFVDGNWKRIFYVDFICNLKM